MQASCITRSEGKETICSENGNEGAHTKVLWIKKYLKWIQVSIYTFFLLATQTIGTLLGRSYFDNGGNSKWMATLVQVVGFPVLLLCLFILKLNTRHGETTGIKPPTSILGSVYFVLGLLVAANCMFYSIGLQYLPVSTYSLICASQLGFNAVFSVFLNREKLTPFVINSAVLLTMSSVVLVTQPDHEETDKISRKKYAIGFVATVVASATYGLVLSLTQLAFQRILKRHTFRVVLEMSVYENMVATAAILVGFFASGEWKTMSNEMEKFKGGKAYYVNNLFWTAVSWQVFGICCIGLIFKVSSLFSNAISVVGLPIAPALAVVFFHDKMTGAKIVSLLLAIWGFISYLYQTYLDDLKAKAQIGIANVDSVQPSHSESVDLA